MFKWALNNKKTKIWFFSKLHQNAKRKNLESTLWTVQTSRSDWKLFKFNMSWWKYTLSKSKVFLKILEHLIWKTKSLLAPLLWSNKVFSTIQLKANKDGISEKPNILNYLFFLEVICMLTWSIEYHCTQKRHFSLLVNGKTPYFRDKDKTLYLVTYTIGRLHHFVKKKKKNGGLGGQGRVDQWEALKWSCNLRANEKLWRKRLTQWLT